jgi:putative peptide zinc metalloprotease protein
MQAPAPTSAPATPPAAPPVLAPGVELLGELSGSGYRRTPGLVRRGDGQTLQVTPLLYQLLGLVDGRRGHTELAEALGRAAECVADPDDIAYLLEEKLRPLGVLQEADGSTLSVKKANPLLALRLKFVITDPELTRRVTSPFARLFRTGVVLPITLVFLLAAYWVLFDRGLASAAHEAIYSPELLLAVFALTLVSAGFHEFGHAAACRYGGATPGAMGGGLYLVWPAFYTDVDDSYRLGRWGRLRVDLGGLYFNALFAVAMAGLALVTGKDAFLLVVATQLLQMLRQLAPFMRADGYHILADLTGVPDLFFHIKPTLLGLWPPNWRRRENRILRPWARAVVTLWVLVVVPVLLGLLALAVWILPRLAATAWDSAGLQLAAMNSALESGDPAGAAVRLLSLFSLFLPVAAITYLLIRIVRSTGLSVWRSTEDRPRLRALALLGAALVVALVCWAWWPSGQYEPVTGNEGGTLQSAALAGPAVGKAPLQPVAASTPDQARAPRQPAGATTLSAAAPASAPSAGVNRASLEARAVAARKPQAVVVQIGVPTGAGTARPDEVPPPVVVVVPSPGPGSPLAPADGSEEPATEWPFPWPQLPAPSDGDNRAIAVNTTDGSSLYAVSYSLVLVDGGRSAENRNEAWALASCTDCKTVAVAFQVVLVVGYSDTYVPVNAAVAANYECTKCVTEAVAVQLVASVTSAPTPEVEQELARAWAPLEWLRASVHQLTVSQIYAVLRSVEQAVLQVLLTPGPTETAEDSVAFVVAESEAESESEPEAGGGVATVGDLSMDGLSESMERLSESTERLSESTERLSEMPVPDYDSPTGSSVSPSPAPAVVLGPSSGTPQPAASPTPTASPAATPSTAPTAESYEPAEPGP